MKPVIAPSRLKALRLRLKLTPTKLAGRLRALKKPVTSKTISNIEKHEGETYPVRENTLNSLAYALGVQREVLSGEAPLPPESFPGAPIQMQPDSRTSLNYELIARRYGVSLEDVFNIAPLLFVKAAEESLTRQKRVLEDEVLEATRNNVTPDERPRSLDMVPEGLLDFMDGEDAGSLFRYRLEAIEKNDICEETVPYDYEPIVRPNPFAAYLKEIWASELGPKMASVLGYGYMGDFDYLPGGRVPQCSVCNDDLEKITLCSSRASLALTSGAVAIKDIPEELWDPKRAGDRVVWLEDMYILAQQQSEQDGDSDDPDQTL